MPERCGAVLDSRGGYALYWFVSLSVAKYRLDTVSWARSVLVMNFDLKQLQKWNLMHLIFCWIFKYQLNFLTNQIGVSFLNGIYLHIEKRTKNVSVIKTSALRTMVILYWQTRLPVVTRKYSFLADQTCCCQLTSKWNSVGLWSSRTLYCISSLCWILESFAAVSSSTSS